MSDNPKLVERPKPLTPEEDNMIVGWLSGAPIPDMPPLRLPELLASSEIPTDNMTRL